MKNIIKNIFVSAFLFLFFDYFYISLTKSHFNFLIKNIQGKALKFNLIGAIICYSFMTMVLNIFILNEKKSINHAIILGLCIYGIFEGTNLAIFDKWDFNTVLMDTIWGGVLFGLVTFFTKYIIKYIN
jgi:uncharacterized membrane protein